MIAIKKKVTKWTPNTKAKQYELIYEENPHIKSRAAYILLVNKYKSEDPSADYKVELQKYFDFRAQFLSKILITKGDLVCQYCGRDHLVIGHTTIKDSDENRKIPNLATLDHVIPLSKGGEKYDENNIVVSCRRCNRKKSNMSVEEFKNKIESKKNNEKKNKKEILKENRKQNKDFIENLFSRILEETGKLECSCCGKKDLIIHRNEQNISHFERFASFEYKKSPREGGDSNDIDNIIVLCKKCKKIIKNFMDIKKVKEKTENVISYQI